MAPSRATLTFLARALTRPRLHSRTGPSCLTSRNGLSIRCPQTSIPALPSTAATVLQSPSRRLYSTAATNTPPSADRPRESESRSKATDDGPEPPDYLSEGERGVFEKVVRELGPSRLEVQDISGGCGSMYAIEIVSSRFKGLSVVKQHRLVNEVLKEEISGWHGVQLKTRAG